MGQLTSYSASSDGYVRGYGATPDNYELARDGSGGKFLNATGTSLYIGQTADFYCYEGFVGFDTSEVPDDATITAVTLSLYGYVDSSDTDFTIQARLFDWSTDNLTTADFRSGDPADAGSLDEYTLVASLSTASYATGAYNVFTSESAFLAGINKSGLTYLVLHSDRQLAGNQPTGNELVRVYAYENTTNLPRLVVDYSDNWVGLTVTRDVHS